MIESKRDLNSSNSAPRGLFRNKHRWFAIGLLSIAGLVALPVVAGFVGFTNAQNSNSKAARSAIGIEGRIAYASSAGSDSGKTVGSRPKSSKRVQDNQKLYLLEGRVLYKSDTEVPKIRLIITNPATNYRSSGNYKGRFFVSLPKGKYNFEIHDDNGYINRYRNLDVSSNTRIIFMFGLIGKVRPTPYPPTPTPTPTPYTPTPTPTPTVIPTPSPVPPGPEPPEPTPTVEPEVEPTAVLSVEPSPTPTVQYKEKDDEIVNPPRKDDGKGFLDSDLGKAALGLLLLAALGIGTYVGWPFIMAAAGWITALAGGAAVAGRVAKDGDEVHCTLYSAPEVNAGSDLLVQVFAHLLEQAAGLDELANELDPDAKKQKSQALKEKIKQDSVLTFKLMVPGIDLDEDEQDIVWRGEPDSVEFIVPIPEDHGAGNRFGRVFVYNNGNEIGKIPFRIHIMPKELQIDTHGSAPRVGGTMTQNETAFVSYASRDKDSVYRFVQLLDVLKYEFHIDIFHIEAGERWEKKLYEFIDTDDVFLLFWSEAASESEWVIREAQRAKTRMLQDKKGKPKIIIYKLDEHKHVPEWLEDIHVDRKWAEIIGSIENQQSG